MGGVGLCSRHSHGGDTNTHIGFPMTCIFSRSDVFNTLTSARRDQDVILGGTGISCFLQSTSRLSVIARKEGEMYTLNNFMLTSDFFL